MPTSFFDLPRELRDQIYGYILLSPTGFVALFSRTNLLPKPKARQGKTSRLKAKTLPSFILVTNPLQYLAVNVPRSRPQPRVNVDCTSLSIRRVCKRTYTETDGMFWPQNQFYFPYFDRSCVPSDVLRNYAGVLTTLKSMGQIASRSIVSLRIDLPHPSHACASLGRILNILASRVRHGNFRRLELVWVPLDFHFQDLLFMVESDVETTVQIYFDFLDALRKGNETRRYERIMRLPPIPDMLKYSHVPESVPDLMDDVAKDIHVSFGGKLLWGDTLAWDNGVRQVPFEDIVKERSED